ncbi:MAG: Rho termination factor [Sphingomonas sp. 28-66-16]|nr:MAG: Rho termination factor [Sphingomonas sp. 28-66-16]
MAKDHGPSIKDDETYEALRADGASMEKAARIANARAGGSLDARGSDLDDRTKDDLYEEAQRIGIAGRSTMTKAELVAAIRDR